MRLYCFECGKSVTNEISNDVIFRGIAQCPECIDKHSPNPLADIAPLPYRGKMPSVNQFASLIYGWLVSWDDENGERHSFDGQTKVIAVGLWNQFVMTIEGK